MQLLLENHKQLLLLDLLFLLLFPLINHKNEIFGEDSNNSTISDKKGFVIKDQEGNWIYQNELNIFSNPATVPLILSLVPFPCS